MDVARMIRPTRVIRLSSRDADLLPHEPVEYIDLAKVNDDGSKISIIKVLPSGEHGIRIQDYLFSNQ